MIPFSRTIGFRLLLISLILLALPIVLHSFYLLQMRHEKDVQDAKSYLKESAYLRELPLSNLQPIRKGVMDTLSLFLDLQDSLPEPSEKLNQMLSELSKVGLVEDIVILKKEKEKWSVIAHGSPRSKETQFSKIIDFPTLFSEKVQKDGYKDFLAFTKEDKSPQFVIARGIQSTSEEPLGALVVIDDASSLLGSVIQPDTTAFTIDFALQLPSSIVIASSDPSLLFHHFFPISQQEIEQFEAFFPELIGIQKQNIGATKDKGEFWQFSWQGKKRVATTVSIPGTEFKLVAYALYSDIYRYPFEKFTWVYLSYILILIAGISIVFLITKRMMKPIQQLCSVMLRVKRGELSARYSFDRFGMQINRLGRQFNEMMDLILKKQQNIEKEKIEKEKNEKQLKIGHEVQNSLLQIDSSVPPQIELALRYIPAKDVGGDFYDFVQKPSGEVVFTIADASGKGMNACCYSLMLKSLLRTLSLNENELGAVMRKANNLFIRDTGMSGMFVTVQMAVLNPFTGDLKHFSFGHNPGFILTPSGEHRVLEQKEMAMGVLEKQQHIDAYQEHMNPGDVLVLYSDGVSEAHNKEKELWGLERLIQTAKDCREKSAEEIATGIMEGLEQFVGSAEQHDDITLLVSKVIQS